jgi:hypothetical protein
VVAAWTAIGASLSAAIAGACAMCLVVPVLGWFIGLPIVLACGAAVFAGWALVLALIVAAWAGARQRLS